MVEDDKTYAPFHLFEYEHEPGSYCLILSDTDMLDVMDVFEEHGRYGNGYGWADVALQAMREGDAELEARVELDPEAGTFVAFGKDLDALERLRTLLHGAFHDHASLGKLVAAAPFEWD